MDSQELRKLLAGLGIAGLLAGTSLMAGCTTNGKSSGGGDKGTAKEAPAKSG